ncbi:hypothetical protein ACIBQ0_26020 [Nocardia nova]|uniref:hypothetical protein n=1 Tax=Nocardia nova TaxID=37330 RepID=UPI0037BAF2F6
MADHRIGSRPESSTPSQQAAQGRPTPAASAGEHRGPATRHEHARTEYEGTELTAKFHPKVDSSWQRQFDVIVLQENEDGALTGPDGVPLTTGRGDHNFILLRSGKLITAADPGAEHPALLHSYMSRYADDDERRV